MAWPGGRERGGSLSSSSIRGCCEVSGDRRLWLACQQTGMISCGDYDFPNFCKYFQMVLRISFLGHWHVVCSRYRVREASQFSFHRHLFVVLFSSVRFQNCFSLSTVRRPSSWGLHPSSPSSDVLPSPSYSQSTRFIKCVLAAQRATLLFAWVGRRVFPRGSIIPVRSAPLGTVTEAECIRFPSGWP